ncbi:Protein of unknown function [Kushneria avicenniae]|uniref:DUF2489 domain-containing protein n=1 Tax=Kushneria avicenniae TaxID=402385 RepID=A0A1I1FC93_9GAMM|nr:DUF2489 domain-containing protein [Kushneria avicenniae]SFB96995.1 Protein of unknown function [Kushneria avicenniae]
MSQVWAIMLLCVAIAIVGILLAIVWRMYGELQRRRLRQEQEQAQAEYQCLSNLNVIGRAMQEGQMDLVEGCLRARVIIDILDSGWWQDKELGIIADVSDSVAHLHTHQARSALTARERMQEDRYRLQVINEHEDNILVAARNLIDRTSHVVRH